MLTEPSAGGEGGEGGMRLAAPAVHRGITLGLGSGSCTRVLRVTPSDDGRYRYEYEMP